MTSYLSIDVPNVKLLVIYIVSVLKLNLVLFVMEITKLAPVYTRMTPILLLINAQTVLEKV